jgi:hypothetical protein
MGKRTFIAAAFLAVVGFILASLWPESEAVKAIRRFGRF